MVVDLVEHHLVAQGVQGADHLAELHHPRPAVLVALGGVGALRYPPVVGVVAPVVGVVVRHGRDGRLLLGGGRASARGDAGGPLGGAVLGDGGDVEGGQQVDGVHAGLGQVRQVTDPGRVLHREGQVGAAQVGRDGGVGGGEVPHVQLVDAAGRVIAQPRGGGGGPLGGRQAPVGQVHGDRAGGVQGQRHRVGVGDEVGLHRPGGGHVDLHLPQVLAADANGPLRVGHAPAPVLAAHGGRAYGRAGHLGHRPQRVPGLPGQQGDGPGGGCPQGEGGAGAGTGRSCAIGGGLVGGGVGGAGGAVGGAVGVADVVEDDAQLGLGGGPGVEVVQDDGGLHPGEGVQVPPGALGLGVRVLDNGDLAGQGRLDSVDVEQGGAVGAGGAQGDVPLQVGVGGPHVLGQVADHAQWRNGGGGQGVGAQDPAVDGCGAAPGGGDQVQGQAGAGHGLTRAGHDALTVHPLGQQGQRPGQQGGGHPVGALLPAAGHRRQGHGVQGVGGGVGEGHGVLLTDEEAGPGVRWVAWVRGAAGRRAPGRGTVLGSTPGVCT